MPASRDTVGTAGVRPEIAQSWFRSRACGLHPDTPLDRRVPESVDTDSTLLRAAEPVFTDLVADLEGTRFGLMLADREACIVGRRFSDSSLESALDGIGAVLGNRFTEETTGTNSIATALEVRRGITIHATEHFMTPMKRFSCYGQPIVNLASRRVEGVLQITAPAEDWNALWAPIVNRAVQDIVERLAAGTRADQQRMLVAFQEATRRSAKVVLLADDIVMSSAGAQRTLESADYAILRDVADRADGAATVTFTDGAETPVRVRRLPDAPGVLLEIVEDRGRRPIPRGRGPVHDPGEVLDAHRRDRTRLLVYGEPGSGRSTTVRRLAGDRDVDVVDAVDVGILGERRWAESLAEVLAGAGGLVVVENVHLLPAAAAARVARQLHDSTAWYALTSGPLSRLGDEHVALRVACSALLEVPPLRQRRDELPAIVGRMLDELAPRWAPLVSARVWEVLRAHPWPANLRELRAVLGHVAGRLRGHGDVVTVEDLPPAYRVTGPGRSPGLLEQVEHDTILRALADCAGNKVRAARLLGISRTTLYKRIRQLGIDA